MPFGRSERRAKGARYEDASAAQDDEREADERLSSDHQQAGDNEQKADPNQRPIKAGHPSRLVSTSALNESRLDCL